MENNNQQQEEMADSDGVVRKRGLFENLDGEQTVNEIESYCMNCEKNVNEFKQVLEGVG